MGRFWDKGFNIGSNTKEQESPSEPMFSLHGKERVNKQHPPSLCLSLRPKGFDFIVLIRDAMFRKKQPHLSDMVLLWVKTKRFRGLLHHTYFQLLRIIGYS